VDLTGNPPVFTLWPGETKSGEGRTLPILPGEMLNTLRALKAERDAKYPEQQYVFTEGATRLGDFRKPWEDACKVAGLPGLLFHDLRRSAVRNLRRAGVSEKVAMGFSGHKTRAVFDRYDISDFADMTDAAKRLGEYLGEDKSRRKPSMGRKTKQQGRRRIKTT
jgi:integrase